MIRCGYEIQQLKIKQNALQNKGTIDSFPGIGSSKTTEINTAISRKGFAIMSSPLDVTNIYTAVQ